jgi:putative sterol carrier protein
LSGTILGGTVQPHDPDREEHDMADQQIDAVTPEQFAELVSGASDEQIEEVVHAVGTKETLDRVFQGFEERFIPEKAEGVTADVLFLIKDGDQEHPYTVSIADGKCETKGESAADPKTTLTTDVVSFVKLITGKEEGVALFMGGKLRISGDLMFAQRIMTFFDRPKAA